MLNSSKASLDAQRLVRRLVSLSEHQLRHGLAHKFLNEGPAENCVQVWRELQRMRQDADAVIARLALLDVLNRQELGYERIADLYIEAKDAGYLSVCFLLHSRTESAETAAKLPKDETPLGLRISAARITPSQEIHRIIGDPDPKIVASLLSNPQLTENDVIRLAARQPTTGGAQLEILRSERWVKRYGVRRAIALNSNTPLDLSLRLLDFLRPKDLRLVSTSPSLPDKLRDAAHYLLEETHS